MTMRAEPTKIRWLKDDPAPYGDLEIALFVEAYRHVDTAPEAHFVQAYTDDDLAAAWEAYQRAEREASR